MPFGCSQHAVPGVAGDGRQSALNAPCAYTSRETDGCAPLRSVLQRMLMARSVWNPRWRSARRGPSGASPGIVRTRSPGECLRRRGSRSRTAVPRARYYAERPELEERWDETGAHHDRSTGESRPPDSVGRKRAILLRRFDQGFPSNTVRELPPGGIVITVVGSREYTLKAIGDRLLNITVWFGTNRPSDEMYREANTQLARLVVRRPLASGRFSRLTPRARRIRSLATPRAGNNRERQLPISVTTLCPIEEPRRPRPEGGKQICAGLGFGEGMPFQIRVVRVSIGRRGAVSKPYLLARQPVKGLGGVLAPASSFRGRSAIVGRGRGPHNQTSTFGGSCTDDG